MQDIKIVISEYAYVCVSEKKKAQRTFLVKQPSIFSLHLNSVFAICKDNLKAGNWFKENIFKSEAFNN